MLDICGALLQQRGQKHQLIYSVCTPHSDAALVTTLWIIAGRWTYDPSLLSLFPKCCLLTHINILLPSNVISLNWAWDIFSSLLRVKKEGKWMWLKPIDFEMSSRGIEGSSECLRVSHLERRGGDNGFHLVVPAFFMIRDRGRVTVSCDSFILTSIAAADCTFADSTTREELTKTHPASGESS